ncbi:MAG: galactose mutarotase [Bacteroidetes bacterium]|nr:galactose mutarotase [Bacteroidota bacterium]
MNIEKEIFGTLPGGKEVFRYTMKNNRGMEVDVICYGATISSIRLPGRDNEPGDVVLGFDTLEEYLGDHPLFGVCAGRVCNRIGNARFELDGKIFPITANEGANQLHGGKIGFDKKLWTASVMQTPEQVSVLMGYESQDGEEGYPGNLLVEIEYSLNDQNELGIRYRAKTDKPTHVNLTNHSYFNLNNGVGNVYDYELFIDSESICELNEESIPTGRILEVADTPYDFRLSGPIGEHIGEIGMGYDINFVLDNPSHELTRVAAIHDPASGRTMEVLTTLPGLQLYTSNYIDRIEGRGGLLYEKHCAVCLETQYYPDSANHPAFPSTVLRPGETFDELTVYRFSR